MPTPFEPPDRAEGQSPPNPALNAQAVANPFGHTNDPLPAETPSLDRIEAASAAGAAANNWAARTARLKRSVFNNYTPEPADAPVPASGEATVQPGTPAVGLLQPAIDQALARAVVHRFIAKCFEDPTPENWAALTDPAAHANLRAAVRILDPGNTRLTRAAGEFLQTLTPQNRERYADAYLVTFGHAARGPCPMNEIEYGNLKADALFQPHRLADLTAFYRAFGLEVAEDAGERPDHVCIELEFMSVLAAKEAWALEHQLDADPLGVVRDAQKHFLREHLGQWLPAFTRRLEREAGLGPLALLARFSREFILAECVRFHVTPGSEDLLLRPVDEAAESLCASCGIGALPPGALNPP